MLLCSYNFFFFWPNSPQWTRASSFTKFLEHTQRRTTVGRTPPDEGSARRRDFYLTTHNTHNRQTSMPPVGFEPTISAGERPQTKALDRAANRTGSLTVCSTNISVCISSFLVLSCTCLLLSFSCLLYRNLLLVSETSSLATEFFLSVAGSEFNVQCRKGEMVNGRTLYNYTKICILR